MSNFELVHPQSGFEYDLQSTYSAFLGSFQVNNLPWYERSWGSYFAKFDDFLAFSWPCIVVTDAQTGRAHIVTRQSAIESFLKMIKQRHGGDFSIPPNVTRVSPSETSQRPLRHLSDVLSYKKLYATLPAAVFSAFRSRVRSGDPKAILELWAQKDKTFLTMAFEWSERNVNTCLEWGYAAVRCGHIDSAGQWPPIPDQNYRHGHYIVSEYVDKAHNKIRPSHPWQYAFGDSLLASKAMLPRVIEAMLTSLMTPESESIPNSLVLVTHGNPNYLKYFEDMKIKIPNNVLTINTALFERALYAAGERHPMIDPALGLARLPGSVLSLEHLLLSFSMPSSDPSAPNKRPIILPECVSRNTGNNAFLGLFAVQMLLEPETTQAPTSKRNPGGSSSPGSTSLVAGGIPTLSTPVYTSPYPSTQRKRASTSNVQLSRRPPHHTRSRTSPSNIEHYGRQSTMDVRSSSNWLNHVKPDDNDLAEEFGAMALERRKAATANGSIRANEPSSSSTNKKTQRQDKSGKRSSMDFFNSFRFRK